MGNRAMSLGEDIYQNYQKRCNDVQVRWDSERYHGYNRKYMIQYRKTLIEVQYA